MIIIASYSNVSVTYTADGTQTVFSFPFDYLRKAFVLVEVNEETILTQGTDYSVSNKTVVFTTAPATGTVLRIFRQTDTSRLVSWADASVLRAKDMTIQQVQNLHILEEQQYWVTENAIIRQGKEWNARNFPIKNVGDPVDPKDAVNKDYTDSNFMKLDDAGDSWEGRGLPVENIATPGKIKDATTKEYVDNLIDKLSVEADRYVVFNTVAAMKAADLPAGYNTRTLGYHDINDGGAGTYSIRGKVVGETEDGGSVIFLANGNVAELITDGTVNVKQFGAYGDETHDDIQAIKNCISSGAKHIVLNGTFYISTPINNVPSDILIDGKGTLIAETTGFEIDGVRHFIIRDLNIKFKTYGIHVTSTQSYVQYGEFQNLTLTGTGSNPDKYGVYLERTVLHLNELRFTNVICWGTTKGFVVYNVDTSVACASHKFLFCSAETATECGWELTNASSISLIFSRIAEANGYKIKTYGVCYRLVIISESLLFQNEQEFSNDTDGVAFGCFRSGLIYNYTFGGYARIVKGKIIPDNDFLANDLNTTTLNSDVSVPTNGSTSVYLRNSWHKYGAAESTLTLEPEYFGGYGLVNECYITMGANAGAVTVVNGDQTVTIPSSVDAATYYLKYLVINGNRRWRYTKLQNF